MEPAVDVAVIAGGGAVMGWGSYMDGAIETGLRGGREIEAILS
jgi:monoamine oxidase